MYSFHPPMIFEIHLIVDQKPDNDSKPIFWDLYSFPFLLNLFMLLHGYYT